MNYKEQAELLLLSLKNKGYSRRALEKELGYSDKSIDQLLSKGANKKFVENIERFNKLLPDSGNKEIPLLKKIIENMEARLADANEKIEIRDKKIERLENIITELKNVNPSKNIAKAK